VYSFQDAPVIAAATTTNSQQLTAIQTRAATKYAAALAATQHLLQVYFLTPTVASL